MKKLLSHNHTKQELRLIEQAQTKNIKVVVAWGCECRGSKKDMAYISSDHEEADTKIILHALDASQNGATEVKIHSPDTDVLILALHRYPTLCQNTIFVTGKGNNRREINLQPIAQALGPSKLSALPFFHSLTGADNTGSFMGKGKSTCWKAFNTISEDDLRLLSDLGKSIDLPSKEMVAAIENLVCQIFAPNTEISSVKELRWWLFRKKQAQSDRLPPTSAALYQAILRTQYQLLMWHNDIIANPVLPSPKNFGWSWDEEEKMWSAEMTTLPPAPNAIIHLVKCNCAKGNCSTRRCQCMKSDLKYTELCGCADGDECENMNVDDKDSTECDD